MIPSSEASRVLLGRPQGSAVPVLSGIPEPFVRLAQVHPIFLEALCSPGLPWRPRVFHLPLGSDPRPSQPPSNDARSPQKLGEIHPTAEIDHGGSWRMSNGRESLVQNPVERTSDTPDACVLLRA